MKFTLHIPEPNIKIDKIYCRFCIYFMCKFRLPPSHLDWKGKPEFIYDFIKKAPYFPMIFYICSSIPLPITLPFLFIRVFQGGHGGLPPPPPEIPLRRAIIYELCNNPDIVGVVAKWLNKALALYTIAL